MQIPQSDREPCVTESVSEPSPVATVARTPLWRRAWFLIVTAVGLIILWFLVPFVLVVFIAQPVRFQGTSMEPALKDGDRLMVQKSIGELKRGDIVVFYYPADTRKSFIKRIIALPGETISIEASGAVYINDIEFQEPYVSPDRDRQRRQHPKSTLAEDEYFVMGDARDASNDSRSWGPLKRKLIYGKVLGRYWPISR